MQLNGWDAVADEVMMRVSNLKGGDDRWMAAAERRCRLGTRKILVQVLVPTDELLVPLKSHNKSGRKRWC